jgi:hypothetical protein
MKEYRAILDDRIDFEMRELSEGVVPKDKDFSIDRKGNVKFISKKEMKKMLNKKRKEGHARKEKKVMDLMDKIIRDMVSNKDRSTKEDADE